MALFAENRYFEECVYSRAKGIILRGGEDVLKWLLTYNTLDLYNDDPAASS
jgi:hypothetical protein